MDSCGSYNLGASGDRYIFVFVDHFTKWIELVPLPDQLAVTVVNAFWRFIIVDMVVHNASSVIMDRSSAPVWLSVCVAHLALGRFTLPPIILKVMVSRST